jgi:hypothetical protein
MTEADKTDSNKLQNGPLLYTISNIIFNFKIF